MRNIEFWVIFVMKNLIKLQEMFLKGKMSLVTSLHLVQQHKVHINNKRTDKILLVYVNFGAL